MASVTFFLPTLLILSTLIIFLIHVKATDHEETTINVTKHFSFPDFTAPKTAHNLMLLGSSTIDKTGRIQIPNKNTGNLDLKHLAGRAIYAYPVRVFDPVTRTPASFQTTFSFQLETTQFTESSGSGDGGGGSGFTFMLAPDEFTVGRPGPWLGMLNDVCDEEYKAVGIEFDTRENIEFGDPNDNHIGINLGSIVSTVTINISEFGVDLKNGEIHRAWIDYYGQDRFLNIWLGLDSRGHPSKPVFAGKLDVSEFLNEYMFVGFSASTGNFTQIHNLISWNFTSTSRASLRVPSLETCESKIVSGNGGSGSGGIRSLNGFFIFMSVVVLAIVALISLYYTRKRGREKAGEVAMLPEVKERPRPPNKARRFTISEVSSATRCFDELHKLGHDERSDAYRGTLLNGCHVVVKRFSVEYFKSCGVNRRHVCKEIKAMSKLRHPNLVPIRGWCFDHQETMVVYDYVPNGVLDDWLYGIGVLPWSRRLKVVRDVALALTYLHSQKHAHKNVKTSSVFIDVSVRAIVGDFGFVMPGAESNRFIEAVAQPTDVFEFGVVLLEVVAGRPRYRSRTESNPESDELDSDLLQWAWTMHEMNKKEKVVDERIGMVGILDQAVRVVEIGLLCTLKETSGRPSMSEVTEYLNFDTETPKLPANRPVTLYPYTSTTQLCSNPYMCASFK